LGKWNEVKEVGRVIFKPTKMIVDGD